MAIIKAKQKQQKEQLRINIDKNLHEKIKQYCEWAGVQKIDDFIEQAAEYVFVKDKDWLTHTSVDKNLLSEKIV